MINSKLTSGIAFISLFVFLILGLSTAGMRKISASADAKADISLPIIMYHSIGENTGKYVISPEMLKEDLKIIKDMGFTTITSADLIAYKEQGTPLPEKSVILTFDDGYFNNYSYVYPLLKKYNMKAVLSVVGKFTEEYSNSSAPLSNRYSHITYEQIAEVSNSGLMEIASHSYNMHSMKERRGILRKKGEDFETYKSNLTQDVEKCNSLLKEKCFVAPVAFTYPFGCVNKESSEIINSLGFKVTYGCEEGINKLTPDHDLKELKRYNRHNTFDIRKVLNMV